MKFVLPLCFSSIILAIVFIYLFILSTKETVMTTTKYIIQIVFKK